MTHKWERGEDVVAYYVARYGYYGIKEWDDFKLSKLFGMSKVSFQRRQINFNWLSMHGLDSTDTSFGSNCAEMTKEIWSKYISVQKLDHLADARIYIKSRQSV